MNDWETSLAIIGNRINTAGVASTALGYLLSVDWVATGGFAVAIAGMLINLHFRRRRDLRERERREEERELHRAQMRAMEAANDADAA